MKTLLILIFVALLVGLALRPLAAEIWTTRPEISSGTSEDGRFYARVLWTNLTRGETYVIECSDDLITWEEIIRHTLTPSEDAVELYDYSAHASTARTYRIGMITKGGQQ